MSLSYQKANLRKILFNKINGQNSENKTVISQYNSINIDDNSYLDSSHRYKRSFFNTANKSLFPIIHRPNMKSDDMLIHVYQTLQPAKGRDEIDEIMDLENNKTKDKDEDVLYLKYRIEQKDKKLMEYYGKLKDNNLIIENLKSIISVQNSKIKILEKDKKKLNEYEIKINDKSKDTIKSLEKEKLLMIEKIGNQINEIKKLESENKELKLMIDDIPKLKAEVESYIKNLPKMLDVIEEKNETIEDLKKKLSKSNINKEACMNYINDINNMTDQIKVISEKLTESKKKEHELNISFLKLQEELIKNANENKELKKKNEEVANNNAKIISSLKEEYMQTVKKLIEKYEAKIKDYEKEAARNKEENNKNKNNNNNKNKDIDINNMYEDRPNDEDLELLTNENQKLKEEITNLNNIITDLRKDNKSLSDINNKNKAIIEQYESKEKEKLTKEIESCLSFFYLPEQRQKPYKKVNKKLINAITEQELDTYVKKNFPIVHSCSFSYNFPKFDKLSDYYLFMPRHKNLLSFYMADKSFTFISNIPEYEYNIKNILPDFLQYNVLNGCFFYSSEANMIYFYSKEDNLINTLFNVRENHSKGCLFLDKSTNNLIIMGGQFSNKVEKFSFKTMTIEQLPDLKGNLNRTYITCCEVEKKIYCFSTESEGKGKKARFKIECLDIKNNSAEEWDDLIFENKADIKDWVGFSALNLNNIEIVLIGGKVNGKENIKIAVYNLQSNILFWAKDQTIPQDKNKELNEYTFNRSKMFNSFIYKDDICFANIDDNCNVHLIDSNFNYKLINFPKNAS